MNYETLGTMGLGITEFRNYRYNYELFYLLGILILYSMIITYEFTDRMTHHASDRINSILASDCAIISHTPWNVMCCPTTSFRPPAHRVHGAVYTRGCKHIPIGVDAGPYIANLTLWYFENKFLENTFKSKYIVANKLGKTYRLIDDITSINPDGYFESHFNDIYPDSLQLNKENDRDISANVLDLNIIIS